MLASAPRHSDAAGPEVAKYRVYIGTYANAPGRGISLLELDAATGELTTKGLAAQAVNPSFLALHPSRRFLYAVGEVDSIGGRRGGGVSAYAVDASSGTLRLLNQQPSGGQGPCFVTVDKEGKNALVANYNSGSVACLPIDAEGKLSAASAEVQHEGSGPDKKRQAGPHAHSINLDAANKFAVAADLGLDKLLIYRFDAGKGTLTPNDPPFGRVAPGAGPRHFAFHPDGRHAYAINEMACTVTAFDYDPERGALDEIQTISTLPEGIHGPQLSTAEVQVHPSGKFLYGSNRGHDSIATFAIDGASGRLRALGRVPSRGKTPRNFGIDPSGRWMLVAGQDSDDVHVFAIDPTTGELSPTEHVVSVPKPVCVKFVPIGPGD